MELEKEKSEKKALQTAVIEKSESRSWEKAKKEWELQYIYYQPHGHCVCGQQIANNCVIRNTKNHNEMVVGNVCVNHFGEEGLTVDARVFGQLKRLSRTTKAGKNLLTQAVRLGIISESTKGLYLSITGKCSLAKMTARQRDTIGNINMQIRAGFSEERPRCSTCGRLGESYINAEKKQYFYRCATCEDNGFKKRLKAIDAAWFEDVLDPVLEKISEQS